MMGWEDFEGVIMGCGFSSFLFHWCKTLKFEGCLLASFIMHVETISMLNRAYHKIKKEAHISMQVAADKKSLIGKESNAQEAKPGKLSSRKGPKASTLSRPVGKKIVAHCNSITFIPAVLINNLFEMQVICICNDLFAPALRPLRQVAKWVLGWIL